MLNDKIDLATYSKLDLSSQKISSEEDVRLIIGLQGRGGANLFIGTIPAGFCGVFHFHRETSVSIVRFGKMRVSTTDSIFELKTGDTLTLPANTVHNMSVIGYEPLRLTEILIPVQP